MKFLLTRTSTDARNSIIEIDTIEDLVALYEKEGTLIITENHGEEDLIAIEIYDDYRE